MYTPDELRAMNRYDVKPGRTARKAIFSLRLWKPARQRLHSQRHPLQSPNSGRPLRNRTLTIGCVNARSVSNKAATLRRVIADEHLDVLAITETWHEGPNSSALRRLTPPGYRFIDAARELDHKNIRVVYGS